MNREEELIRSTTKAIASTVREVPPLRLEPDADETRSRVTARRKRRGGRRDWLTWGAPLAAAAVVVALAIALVAVRDMPDDRGVSPSPAGSAGPGGTPRYYVALKSVVVKPATQKQAPAYQYDAVVGDSVTGKTLVTIPPPAHTIFQSVSGAADDLTFVIFAVSSPDGTPLDPGPGNKTLTGSWYKLRLSPGTASPARLSLLPVKPWSWVEQASLNASPGQVYATALSASGQELAVADIPDVPGAKVMTGDWHEVKVFSVATGLLLHDWTENNPAARLAPVTSGTLAGVPAGTPALTWIDDDRAIALATAFDPPEGPWTGTVRKLNVSGPTKGSLTSDSTVIWAGELTANAGYGCYAVDDWPPMISADGKSVSCVNYDELKTGPSPWMLSLVTDPFPPGARAAFKPRFDYKLTSPLDPQGKPLAGGAELSLQWASPSGDTFIVALHYIESRVPGTSSRFLVISHGKATPLQLPAGFSVLEPGQIAW